MNLSDVVSRPEMEPWSGGGKIPWNDPAFSARMLSEHLSQKHDAASRRLPLINAHVNWIHREVLGAQPAQILDLGCGPGLYTSKLAQLGHRCVGIDFSPASVEYARTQAKAGVGQCEYRLRDLRLGDFGTGYRLALLTYGELNVFRREEASHIVTETYAALARGGHFILEVHTRRCVEALGSQPPTWRTASRGLFSETSHICLRESVWSDAEAAAVARYFVVDTSSSEVSVICQTIVAYDGGEYRALLERAGFESLRYYGSLAGDPPSEQSDFLVIVASKPEPA